MSANSSSVGGSKNFVWPPEQPLTSGSQKKTHPLVGKPGGSTPGLPNYMGLLSVDMPKILGSTEEDSVEAAGFRQRAGTGTFSITA